MLKIHPVGGYSEVGKNMTVLETDSDAMIFDSGLYLPAIVEIEERDNFVYNEASLRSIGALPNDTILRKGNISQKVRAMLISHGHLDHVGAVPFNSNNYNAEIVGTPFTMAILDALSRDEKIKLKNKHRVINPNSSYVLKAKKNYTIEYLNQTHSIIQNSMIAVHTKDGVFVYCNDFKFDNTPVFGKKPNYDAFKRLGKEGVKAVVINSLYSNHERKTPSEKIAKDMLEEVLFTTDNEKAAIVVTTFSSHIARLKSIVEFGNKLGRSVVFLGRSLNRYYNAARSVNQCPFENDIKIASYRRQLDKILKQIDKNRDKYLVVCTGHQGEPGSILERISRNKLPFNFKKGDHLIFSSKTIPTPVNIGNKSSMEKRFRKNGVRIFNDIHVSGHAGREDLREMINMLQPENIIPTHGDHKLISGTMDLAAEMGYKSGKNVHLLNDSQTINIK